MGRMGRAFGIVVVSGMMAGCAPGPAPLPYISPRARAALPPGTDLHDVKRRADGCYFIQTKDDLSGYLTPVTDTAGKLICDDS
ncbi:hypothetical protein [Acidimangrovimonas pyrenivorans]|uniref:Lipoprotein n=1 Tax=Acidimangrovimonas pyrenivorans TaxID=2030798 RepID=A0ABV7AHB7_9RHOB